MEIDTMKKTITAAFVSSVLAVSAMTVAHAASSTTVNVMGTVNAATCDVVANTQTVNLGNAKPAAFTTINTAVASTKQQFAISLQNCSGAGAGQAALKVSGPVTNAGNTYFAKDASSPVAVSLTDVAATKELTNGAVINMGNANDNDAALNGVQKAFEVALKSSQTNPTGGVVVEAPLTFSFVYN
ncbi:TPA: type 1 fimbrial protein [Escherichia coli]|nr:type 1 fimbrial protein [Escherichia coli]HAV8194928.1 type 1 fimbrial protein [Escherichia coli]HAV8250173.1 type 1 fimbrial protein [Escherichia coli]HAW0685731.1 type 1 fimbrial protein [Escherichia coli]HCK2681008.1 type 1 fimbrial protein [Escherichia coli]